VLPLPQRINNIDIIYAVYGEKKQLRWTETIRATANSADSMADSYNEKV